LNRNWAGRFWQMLRRTSRLSSARPSGSDEALRLLNAGCWRCVKCEQDHGWPFDLAARAPDHWPHPTLYSPNNALSLDGDFLSEDFCVLGGEHFFVRSVLSIPVRGLDDAFGFGCWSTLSRKNFESYIAQFDGAQPCQAEMWHGWLCNGLADLMGTEPVAVWVQLQPDRQRPKLWIQNDHHPMAIAQDEGITPQQMVAIMRHYGHDPGTST